MRVSLGSSWLPWPTITTVWRKSSFSGDVNSDCVEVALTSTDALVRDSKNADGSVLRFSVPAWQELIRLRPE
jgi:hypothetical protein